MGTLKKTAAIICSAATLVLAGVSAISANAFETVKLDDRASELSADKMMFVADEVYAEPGETVDYSVYVQKNSGYSSGGITMYFDPSLKIEMADDIKAYCMKGAGAEGLTPAHSLNQKSSIFGFSVMGTDNCTNNDKVYTIRFTVPADATAGSTYPIRLETVEIIDEKSALVDCTTIAGWIKVPEVTTTTTSATVVTTTTTIRVSDVTTTTTAQIPVISTTTTTVPVSDIGTTTTTTGSQKDQVTTTTTIQTDRKTEKITDDTQHNPGDQEQTTAKRTTSANGTNPNAGKKSEATKTGDAGVAVAAAALLIAGASALVFRRREQ